MILINLMNAHSPSYIFEIGECGTINVGPLVEKDGVIRKGIISLSYWVGVLCVLLVCGCVWVGARVCVCVCVH